MRCKTEYDQATQVVEAQRHRVERREANEKPTDKGHKNKAAADLDMKHAKDSYLLSVTAANEANAHYFHHSIPALQEVRCCRIYCVPSTQDGWKVLDFPDMYVANCREHRACNKFGRSSQSILLADYSAPMSTS